MKRGGGGILGTALLQFLVLVLFAVYSHAMCLRKGANSANGDKPQVSPHGDMNDILVTNKNNEDIGTKHNRVLLCILLLYTPLSD